MAKQSENIVRKEIKLRLTEAELDQLPGLIIQSGLLEKYDVEISIHKIR